MTSKATYICIANYIAACRTAMLCLLFSVAVISSQDVFAQSEQTQSDTATDEVKLIHQDKVDIPVRDVEVGSGGNVKLERKYRTKIESQYEWHAHLLWESRYVTEGRDNLSGKGLLSASTEFNVDEFSVVPWVADGIGIDYSEFNLNIVYGSRLTENLVLYTGYNFLHSRFLGDSENDNEISFDLAYKWFKHVNFLASIYHSFDAEGSFMETSVRYNNKINNMIHYGIQGVLGVNAEYVPDGHNGLNHFQLRANASYYPDDNVELYAYTGYSLAINRDAVKYAGDELLGDFFWGGIGLSYLF